MQDANSLLQVIIFADFKVCLISLSPPATFKEHVTKSINSASIIKTSKLIYITCTKWHNTFYKHDTFIYDFIYFNIFTKYFKTNNTETKYQD